MRLALGVDAGNTKTVALVASLSGVIVGSARSLGIADIYAAPDDKAAMTVVERAVDDAVRSAGLRREDVGSAAVSIAGADWPEDIDLIQRSLAARGIGRDVQVVNDAIGALHGAVPEGPAVVVAIGTGAATGARGMDGRLWHSSWWQEPQGAYELSRKVLVAVYRAELGIEPPTHLRDSVLAAVGETSVEAVLHRFTARRQPRPHLVGSLLRALLDHAGSGDPAAAGIVADHGRALGQVASAAARQVGIADLHFALAFSGGVSRLAGARGLIHAAVQAARAEAPSAEHVAARFEPAIGALILALGLPDAPNGQGILDRLEDSAPPGFLYEASD